MNKICKEYISEVKLMFPVMGRKEKDYIKKLALDVEEFCEEAEVKTKEELYENYGKPQEVVSNYFSSADTEYIAKHINITHYVKRCVVGLLVLAVVTVSVYSVIAYAFHMLEEANDIYGLTIDYHLFF